MDVMRHRTLVPVRTLPALAAAKGYTSAKDVGNAALATSFQHHAPEANQPTSYVYGSNWAVGCFIASACESAHKVLGGKLGQR